VECVRLPCGVASPSPASHQCQTCVWYCPLPHLARIRDGHPVRCCGAVLACDFRACECRQGPFLLWTPCVLRTAAAQTASPRCVLSTGRAGWWRLPDQPQRRWPPPPCPMCFCVERKLTRFCPGADGRATSFPPRARAHPIASTVRLSLFSSANDCLVLCVLRARSSAVAGRGGRVLPLPRRGARG
jgi:hypothetical protein